MNLNIKWLSNYASLFLWVIIYGFIVWWIVYIQHPDIKIDYRIGSLDHRIWGLKQMALNFPFFVSFFVLIIYRWLFISSLTYKLFTLFNGAKYYLFAAIPVLGIIKLFYAWIPIEQLGLKFYEYDFASPEVIDMIHECLMFAKYLFVFVFIHFLILQIINRKQPFPKFMDVSIFLFFALWWIFYIAQVIFLGKNFNFFRLFFPDNLLVFYLFGASMFSYFLYKQIKRKWLILLLVSFIVIAQMKFSVQYYFPAFFTISMLFIAYVLIYWGLLKEENKKRTRPIISGTLFMCGSCILWLYQYGMPAPAIDLIPFFWSSVN